VKTAAPTAAAVLLAAVLTSCTGSGDDETPPATPAAASAAAPSAPADEPAKAEYTARLVAFLKTTSQGAHVLDGRITTEKGKHYGEIRTDVPAYGKEDYSGPAVTAETIRAKLAREAEDWATEHREVDLELIKVTTADGTGFSLGTVPDQDERQARNDEYAAGLLAHLKTTPHGAEVTRVKLDRIFDQAEIVIVTTAAPYDSLDFGPGAAPSRATVTALLDAADSWLTAHPEHRVTSLVAEDRERGNAEVRPR
jgi:osmotically-inducible protein OsmY